MSLVRRAQLAVTAHIRHEYTDYDRIIKSTGWAEARRQVQKACLDILVQWRGDDDEDGELEDILREVIVISDDEDENEETQQVSKAFPTRSTRSESVEIISADEVNTHPVNYAMFNAPNTQGRSPSFDVEATDATGHLDRRPAAVNQPLQFNQQQLAQFGAHRQRMWEEAVIRRRENPGPLPIRNAPPPIVSLNDSNKATGSLHSQGQRPQNPRWHPYMNDYTLRAEPNLVLEDMKKYSRSSQDEGVLRPLKQVSAPSIADRLDHFIQDEVSMSKCGGHADSNQVVYAHNDLTVVPQRVQEQDTVYHSRNFDPFPFPPSAHNRPQPVQSRTGDPRIIQLNRGQEHNVSLRSVPHRQGDLILPSVEAEAFDARGQQIISLESPQNSSGLDKQDKETRDRVHCRAPSLIYVDDDEQPIMKKRRVSDQLVREQQPDTILIPLDRSMPDMYDRPAVAQGPTDEPRFVLDKRIIPIPPRDVRRYRNGEGHSEGLPWRGQFDDRAVHRVPYEEPQAAAIMYGIPNKSESLRPAAFHSLPSHESPMSSRIFVPPRYRAYDGRSSLSQVTNLNGSGHTRNPDVSIGDYPHQTLNSGRFDVQKSSRQIGVHPSALRTDEGAMSTEMHGEREQYTFPQKARAYSPSRGNRVLMEKPEETHQRFLFPQSSASRRNQEYGNERHEEISTTYSQKGVRQIVYDQHDPAGQCPLEPPTRRADWFDPNYISRDLCLADWNAGIRRTFPFGRFCKESASLSSSNNTIRLATDPRMRIADHYNRPLDLRFMTGEGFLAK